MALWGSFFTDPEPEHGTFSEQFHLGHLSCDIVTFTLVPHSSAPPVTVPHHDGVPL